MQNPLYWIQHWRANRVINRLAKKHQKPAAPDVDHKVSWSCKWNGFCEPTWTGHHIHLAAGKDPGNLEIVLECSGHLTKALKLRRGSLSRRKWQPTLEDAICRPLTGYLSRLPLVLSSQDQIFSIEYNLGSAACENPLWSLLKLYWLTLTECVFHSCPRSHLCQGHGTTLFPELLLALLYMLGKLHMSPLHFSARYTSAVHDVTS